MRGRHGDEVAGRTCGVDLTPEIFWRAALATGDPARVQARKKTYPGRFVDPARLIESLR